MLITVLNDGETYTDISGSMIAVIPDDVEDVEDYLKVEKFDHLLLSEITEEKQILKFMRIFFPQMQVEEDNEGQIIIYTGVYSDP